MRNFVGREKEIQLLDHFWESNKAEMVIMYGRRRVGKTTLLDEWRRRRNPKGLYWVAKIDSSTAQLRSFSQTVYEYVNPEATSTPSLISPYASWEDALEKISILAEDERILLIIDEYTFLTNADPSISSSFQNYWDSKLKNTKIMLVITGSHLGMMRREFADSHSPLYGRMTGELHLRQLPFGITPQYFPGLSAEERVQIFSMIGGIPGYWDLVETQEDMLTNVMNIFSERSRFSSEVQVLLNDYLSNPHNYVSILRALSYGYRDRKTISSFSGIPVNNLSQYISNLETGGYIEARISITQRGQIRNKRYYIIDPALRFYFRFLRSMGASANVPFNSRLQREVERHWNEFIGTHTFEELCKDWLLLAGAELLELPLTIDEVGSIWSSIYQVDVAGISFHERTLILGECKWTGQPHTSDEIFRLAKIAKEIIPSKETDNWNVMLIGFSKSGWTDEAYALQKDWNVRGLDEHPWNLVGIQLLDLNDIDLDYQRWASQ